MAVSLALALIVPVAVLRLWAWPDVAEIETKARVAADVVLRLRAELDQAQRELVVHERAIDVARQTNRGLQQEIGRLQSELGSARADVAFFERLIGGAARQEGLAIQAPRRVADMVQVYLTQSGDSQRLQSGVVHVEVSGLDGSDRRRLRLSRTAGEPLSFRFFGRVELRVELPAGFTPEQIHIEFAGESRRIEQSFDWP